MSELSSQFAGGAVAAAAVVTDTVATVLAPLDVQAFDRFAIYVQNIAGGNDLTSLDVETAPTSLGPWVTLSTPDFLPLAAEATGLIQLSGKAVKFLRLRATCDAGEATTLNIWLSAGGA